MLRLIRSMMLLWAFVWLPVCGVGCAPPASNGPTEGGGVEVEMGSDAGYGASGSSNTTAP